MKFSRTWWLLFGAVTVAGVALRFAGLERKLFWYDEMWTALHLNGRHDSEIRQELLKSGQMRPSELRRLVGVNPQHGLRDTLLVQATEYPQIAPLHMAMIRLWACVAGDSVRGLRLFSVLASVLALGAAWWLCRELFGGDGAAPVAVTLFAVSPMMLLYAQEAREYSLWVLMILVSSAVLARAARLDRIWWWRIYAVAAAAGLYTHFLFVFVLAAQGVAAQATGRGRQWIRSGLLTVLLFAPWAVVIARGLPMALSHTCWNSVEVNRMLYAARLTAGRGGLVMDFGMAAPRWVVPLAGVGMTVVVGSGLWLLARRKAWMPVWLLGVMWVAPLLALVAVDLCWGGQRVTVRRYLMMVDVAMLILIAWRLAASWERMAARAGWLLLMVAGLASGVLMARATTWWNKGPTPVLQIATAVNAAPRPLLLCNVQGAGLGELLVLSRCLDERVRVCVSATAPQRMEGDVFALHLSDECRKALVKERGAIVELIPNLAGQVLLWRVKENRVALMKWSDSSRMGRPFAKDPSVIRFDGRYLMYYSMAPSTNKAVPKGWAIGIAESRNLVRWNKVGEILPEQECEKNGLCASGARVLDGRVHIFYQTYGNGPRDAICHAVSDDGLRFSRDSSNPVFRPSGDWTVGRAIDAEVIEHGDRLLLYYATRDPAMKIQMLGVAAADRRSDLGRNAWKQFGDGPILKPELPWETKCIEAPTVLKRGDTFYLFYAGGYNNEPQQIGCATSKDGVHFQRLFVDAPLLANGKPGEWNSSESGHPGVFVDDDGQTYLFYQGNNDRGRTWYLSCVKLGWRDDRPYVLPTDKQAGN